METDPLEFELGELVEVEKPQKEAGMVVSVRLDRADSKLLTAVAKRSNKTVSQVSREALHVYLTGIATSATMRPTFGSPVSYVIFTKPDYPETKGNSFKTAYLTGQQPPYGQSHGAVQKIA